MRAAGSSHVQQRMNQDGDLRTVHVRTNPASHLGNARLQCPKPRRSVQTTNCHSAVLVGSYRRPEDRTMTLMSWLNDVEFGPGWLERLSSYFRTWFHGLTRTLAQRRVRRE